ncbi:MAG: M20 family metallo-hydrolase [Candidatus Micrarchaeota archaeon]|nr:M20 family metallo-hydrolase [Candidatus Micrarchaeota archaeon]
MPGSITEAVEGYRQDMLRTMERMIAIPAISPLSGGKGEKERAGFLKSVLESWGFKVDVREYQDSTGTPRTNLTTKLGSGKKTIWIVPHIDTVSEGDRALWDGDPFKARFENGKIYGRGTSDDGQSVVSAMYTIKALKDFGEDRMKYGLGLAFAADEELGSKYGIQKLIDDGIFGAGDLAIVPDSGNQKGDAIEIAEKAQVWLKITAIGKEVHAATPAKGVNAYRKMIKFLADLDERLHNKYGRTDQLFHPPGSTFEMTKHEKNVESMNIIPGIEVSYIDCRLLPDYDTDELLSYVKSVAEEHSTGDYDRIAIDVAQKEPFAPPTSRDSEIVRLLSEAIRRQRGFTPTLEGIGGGTCAAFLRRKGIDTAVWMTYCGMAHQPNEYTYLDNIVNDAKVFASLFVD